jgi:mannose-6-phosphate isomerase
VIFVPAGLLHTLGKGLKVCEIQQNSDLTYRFWDFNRPGSDGQPRQLHIDEGATVAISSPWAGGAPPLGLHSDDLDRRLLAACPYFAAEKLAWSEDFRFRADADRFLILIILDGTGSIAGEPYGPGTTFLVPAHAEAFEARPETPTQAVCAYEPDLPALRASLEKAGAPAEVIRRVVHE